jgi:hypothetical protein
LFEDKFDLSDEYEADPNLTSPKKSKTNPKDEDSNSETDLRIAKVDTKLNDVMQALNLSYSHCKKILTQKN